MIKHKAAIVSSLLTMALLIAATLKLNFSPCIIRQLTGLYCPVCGSTRAVRALYTFNIIKSLESNPLVIYTGTCFYVYSIAEHLNIHKKLSSKTLKIILKTMIIFGVILMITNCIIQNIIKIL